jgi:hypothetical protein
MSQGVIHHHNNAMPHSTRALELLQAFHCELLDNPPHSPNLVLLDYHLFGLLKQHLGGHQFHNIRMWKWLVMNGCKCMSLIPTEMGYLHSHQDGINASICLGIMLENNDIAQQNK